MTFNIFNIAYDRKTYEESDPFFQSIGDLSNPFPDLFEYHHILRYYEKQRRFWSNTEYYGFLSPNFFVKTGFNGVNLVKKLSEITAKKHFDIIIINPWWRLFQDSFNSFDQAESHHPGIIYLLDSVLATLKYDFHQQNHVSHSLNTTYSNFFVAKPHIWDLWVAFTKEILLIASSPSSAISKLLNSQTRYRSGTAKILIFLLERVINLLIITKVDHRQVGAVDPFIFRKDTLNIPPSNLLEIDKVRLHFSEGQNRDRTLVCSHLWEMRKLSEIGKMISRNFLHEATAVVRNEKFSALFAGELELLKVKILTQAGQFHEALIRLSKNHFAEADRTATRDMLLYRLFVKLGKFSEARAKIEALDSIYPGSHVLACDLATVMLLMGDYDNLSLKISSLMAEFPSSWTVTTIASKFFLEIGDLSKAKEMENNTLKLKDSPRRLEWNF